jgi:hypothetical protein
MMAHEKHENASQHLKTPSPLQGEDWDGGSAFETEPFCLDPTIGTPHRPSLTLPLTGGGDYPLLILSCFNSQSASLPVTCQYLQQLMPSKIHSPAILQPDHLRFRRRCKLRDAIYSMQ